MKASLRRKITICCLALLTVMAAGVPLHAEEEVVCRIVAKVNGEIITLYELNERIKPMLSDLRGGALNDANKAEIMTLKRRLLDVMIDDLLIQGEAARLGVEVRDQEVKARVDEIKSSRGMAEKDFEDFLLTQGLTQEEFERDLRNEMLRSRMLTLMVRSKVVVVEEEVRAYYETHKDQFRSGKTVTLALLAVREEQTAEVLDQRIRLGELSFAEAVRAYSLGPNKEEGGIVGTFEWKELAPEWRELLNGLSAGEVTEVFPLQSGFGFLQLISETAGEDTSFEEARPQIEEALYQPKLEKRFTEYIAGLRENAIIDVCL